MRTHYGKEYVSEPDDIKELFARRGVDIEVIDGGYRPGIIVGSKYITLPDDWFYSADRKPETFDAFIEWCIHEYKPVRKTA